MTFYGFFLFYAAFAGYTAYQNGAEGFDGYSFLGQTWRVTDSAHAKHFYEPARPRTFVGVMAVIDGAALQLSGQHLTTNEYHLVTCLIVLTTMLLWVWALKGIFSSAVAYTTGTFLLFHYLYFIHTAFVLADVLASTLWAVFFGALFRFLDLKSGSLDRRKAPWVGLGVIAGLIATTKYGHFLFLPVFAFFLWCSCRLGIERRPFPWRGMGFAFLAHFAVIELMYRTLGGWQIGYWYPVKLHLQLAKEYVPGAQAAETVAFHASRRWLYLQDFVYAYGPALFALGMAGLLNWVAVRKGKVFQKEWLQAPKASGIVLFFGCLLAVAAMHQVIAVKETRYFLPFIPGMLSLFALAIVHLLQNPNKLQRAMAVVGLYAALAIPFARLVNSADILRELAENPEHHELPQLFAFLKKELPHGKQCRILHVCDRTVMDLRLDRNVYGVHLPGVQVERMFCAKATEGVAQIRNQMAAGSLDEFNEELCFVNADSRTNLTRKPPIEALRPLAIQVSDSERQRWEKAVQGGGERVKCERTPTGYFDCYLSHRFFGWG